MNIDKSKIKGIIFDYGGTLDTGGRLQTGVYLYRVRAGSDGSKKTSKAKKLIVLGNN